MARNAKHENEELDRRVFTEGPSNLEINDCEESYGSQQEIDAEQLK